MVISQLRCSTCSSFSKTLSGTRLDHRLAVRTFHRLWITVATGGGTLSCVEVAGKLVMGSLNIDRRLKPGLVFAYTLQPGLQGVGALKNAGIEKIDTKKLPLVDRTAYHQTCSSTAGYEDQKITLWKTAMIVPPKKMHLPQPSISHMSCTPIVPHKQILRLFHAQPVLFQDLNLQLYILFLCCNEFPQTHSK